jgi:hypothetical protein
VFGLAFDLVGLGVELVVGAHVVLSGRNANRRGYVLGNLAVSVIAGVRPLIWLLIFGVPCAVLLAITVAVLDPECQGKPRLPRLQGIT